MTEGGSVFLAALGDEAGRLRPECRDYAEGPGTGVVVGEGVFSVAGSRFGRLGLLMRPFVGPRLLMTAHGRDVPFRVENRVTRGRDGAVELRATRTFRFPSGDQEFVDVLRAGDGPGALENVLGDAGRVELRLRAEVMHDGGLGLRSERAYLRLGRIRIPLPRLLSVTVAVVDGFDEAEARQTVDVVVRNPILGTVMEYRGWFRWRREDAA